MGRRRNPEHADLPVGLYANRDKGSATGYYFYYKNPFFGVEGVPNNNKPRLPFGADKISAIKKAEQVKNAYLAYTEQVGTIRTNNAIIQASKAKKLFFCLPKFKKVQADKVTHFDGLVDRALVKLEEDYHNFNITMSCATYRDSKSYLNRIKKRWDNLPVEYISLANIQIHIDEVIISGKLNTAKKFTSAYKELLNYGLRYSLIDFDSNPAEEIKTPKIKVKKSRLSAMTAIEVLESEELNYQPNKLSIKLGLITTMRPQDFTLTRKEKGDDWEVRVQAFIENRNAFDELALSDFAAYADKAPYPYINEQENCLVYFSQKTGGIAAIDLDLYNNTLEMTLRDLITDIEEVCTFSDSPYLIHHTVKNSKVKQGSPINPSTLSKRFTRAVKELGKNWLNGSHPTLYELRSLGMRNEPVKPFVVIEKAKSAQQSTNNETCEIGLVVSTFEEKVSATRPIKLPSKLGGHTSKSKMPKDVYFKRRDLAYQQLSGFT